MSKHLTIKEAAAIVRAFEMSFAPLPETGEFRINIRKADGGSEATAYYATDLQDAIDTAESMARWRDGKSQFEAWESAMNVLHGVAPEASFYDALSALTNTAEG